MTGEILTIQVGQCGNHVGKQFWDQLTKEHGIGKDGQILESSNGNSTDRIFREDDTNPFFKQYQENKYTPRAIMIDLEPSVINDNINYFPDFFDPRGTWVSKDRYGAGNSWANGYDEGQKNQDIFLNMIDKQLDSTENFEGFQLLHSVAGGTGSGLGSNLLEALADRYQKKLLTTYSVFPSDQSEVVVQPYNTILTLRRLAEDSDASVVFDNNALSNLSGRVFQKNQTDYNQTNQLIASVLSSTTNSVRFPSYLYSSLQSIFSTLIPSPELHFLTPAFTPFTSDYITGGMDYKRNTAYDILLDLIDEPNSLVSKHSKKPIYLNVFCTIIGDIERNDISRGINKIQQRLQFAAWSPTIIHVNNGRRSNYLKNLHGNQSQVNGMMLANSSGIVPLFEKVCGSFDKIYSKKAFLNAFQQSENFDADDFIESREVARSLIEEYTAAEEKSYLDEVLLEDENVIGEFNENNNEVDAEGDNIM
ncbi:similar to Saccharomyces cerevisiae YLR212C TUB4 Gamma-tubulin, involved in nucleating microtubules from both the cytoplasmic and nuclear faces of the spindle pole body [Maudiozyma saulgeensis]|uniref:Tubulin gamma chain n=1 Tax=Maudiozyma saulgeensis TaxID=1789683 RepID=A0A1X7R2I7_9SACH|nr:similar to Saccharomyces cerevisiae YLR212C TUB4 Gamma-tubulin, involved in nucleating microtubules from both the cytoplasmic and nuclear faces of the spindle pole body [Kazachstania saulgeensis]